MPERVPAILAASRVPETVSLGEFGLWKIGRRYCATAQERKLVGWDSFCILGRMTEATMHLEYGDIVMEDSRRELCRHLPIWLAAEGRVLLTGLGLGCVVRGLLACERVDHVDVIEVDRKILDRIGAEFANNERITLLNADAFQFPLTGQSWDWAWHDIWDENKHVAILHLDLMARFKGHARRQSAWAMPRFCKRLMGGEFWQSGLGTIAVPDGEERWG